MIVPLADETLRAWGGAARPPRLVTERENAVYEVHLADGTHAALRLHRAGYRSPEAVCAELDWTARLAAEGFACPRPVPTRDGAFWTTAPDGRLASVVAWVSGEPMQATPARMERLGTLIARLHLLTDTLAPPPDATRFPQWTAAALLGPAPIWGRFWDNDTLDAGERRVLERTRAGVESWLAALPDPDLGLIHADLLPDNVLDDGGTLWAIDFDDCGLGHRGYDLGTALVSHIDHPDFPALRGALIDGYAAHRGDRAELAERVAAFTLLRALASCGWVMSRTPPGDPRRRAYADRAVRLAAAWGGDALR